MQHMTNGRIQYDEAKKKDLCSMEIGVVIGISIGYSAWLCIECTRYHDARSVQITTRNLGLKTSPDLRVHNLALLGSLARVESGSIPSPIRLQFSTTHPTPTSRTARHHEIT